jgi:hypothetical protein
LSDVELERLTARSLVRDTDASLDVRLARAFSSLEGLKARNLKLEQVPYRLWCHDARDRAHRLADDAVNAVSGFFLQGPLPDETARQDLNGRQAEMLAGTRGRSPSAIGAEDARDRQTRTACLGSLRQEPSVRRAPRAFAEVLEALSPPEADRGL